MTGEKVWFAHLDLGIGGAEQLVVNSALALQQKGYDVTIFTTHHDPTHCFAPTRGHGPLAKHIIVAGDWLPRQIFGKGTAFCSYLRMVYLAVYMILQPTSPHAVFCDGVSLQIPLLSLRSPVFFYCHHPDKLLCTERGSFLKRLYRGFLDPLEEWTTLCADKVAVNSNYTGDVFMKSFSHARTRPEVLYPNADLDRFTQPDWSKKPGKDFLSLNRFERKKNVQLALHAFAKLNPRKNKLIVAGGYDEAVTENVEYLKELKEVAKQLNIADDVSFRPSVSDSERDQLMQSALAVLYTPDNEHFGIVPIEAMYAGNPVLAPASGGPLETVVDKLTGFLLPSTPTAFAQSMQQLHDSPELAERLGRKAHTHVIEKFGSEAFAHQLDSIMRATISIKTSRFTAALRFLVGIAMALVAWLAFGRSTQRDL